MQRAGCEKNHSDHVIKWRLGDKTRSYCTQKGDSANWKGAFGANSGMRGGGGST